MKSIHIINYRFVDNDYKSITVGGIQTYIINLCKIAQSLGVKTRVYQMANIDCIKTIDGIEVCCIKCLPDNLTNKVFEIIPSNDIVIFATEELVQKYNGWTIAIQHGIYWDRPKESVYNTTVNNLYIFRRAWQAFTKIRQMEQVNQIICVDYNFVNWYRSIVAKPNLNIKVIPNFTDIPEEITKDKNTINIIFARRFIPFRGSRIFTNVIIRILEEFKDVNVTVAGEGPDENWMHNKLDSFSRVRFERYESDKSLEIHSHHHIAVVPTTGSEGTSLSLLEAMACKCSVICTDVGGLTNIVINRFNGLMVPAADEHAFYDALKELIINEKLRNHLAKNAYETVKCSFSYQTWYNEWFNILSNALVK